MFKEIFNGITLFECVLICFSVIAMIYLIFGLIFLTITLIQDNLEEKEPKKLYEIKYHHYSCEDVKCTIIIKAKTEAKAREKYYRKKANRENEIESIEEKEDE